MTGAFTAAGWHAPCSPRLQSSPQQGQKLLRWSAKAQLGEGGHLAQWSSAAASQLLLFSFPATSVSGGFLPLCRRAADVWNADKRRRTTHTCVLLERATPHLPPGHCSHSPRLVGSIPELIQLNPPQAWNGASGVLSWHISHPACPNAFPSLVSCLYGRTRQSSVTHRKWSRKHHPTSPPLSFSVSLAHAHTAPSAYFLAPAPGLHLSKVKLCHLAMATWALSLERKVQIFPIDFRKRYFGPHRKKWVGQWVFLVFYLWVGFHFCCSNLQAGNRGLGHCDIFSLQGGQKRWMLPSGDTLLCLILERKKFVISLETCAKEFSWFWPCKLALALVNQKFIFHINPVPWL